MANVRLNTKLIGSLHSVLLMQAAEVREAAGIARSTWYDIMRKPDGLTVQQLLGIANGLHIPVRRFFSTGRADVIGRRDDYVTDPYAACRYEGDRLRETINDRRDATWKRAGEIAGMSYQHIQRSLASETRTPVVRFLAVCEAFGIDPFQYLVDPNPEPVKEQRHRGGRHDDATAAEVERLREDVGRLGGTVADVTEKYSDLLEKYDTLLDEHRRLLRRFDELVLDVSGRSADDERTAPKPDR